jgi:hypothetical protein
MTLVVGAQNNDYALQVSDRRLTAEDGSVVDDESNKLYIFESDSCRFLVGYSGLARLSGTGGFDTKDWLAEALRDAAPPDYIPDNFIERLRVAATARFTTRSVRRLKPSAQLMSIMLNGFVYTSIGPLVSYCVLTNYQDFERGDDDREPWPEFRAWWRILQDPVKPAWSVGRIGAWRSFATEQIDAVKALVISGRPPKAVVGKTVELIRAVAGPPGTHSTVGRQLMSAIILSDASKGSSFAYHSDTAQTTYHMAGLVISNSQQGGVIIRDGMFAAVEPDAPPVIFPTQRRNQLCACGSGKKYKRCHGATSQR